MIFLLTDPPTLSTLSQQDIIEGNDLSLTCTVTPGNPSITTFYLTKADNQGFRQNGPTLQLYNIQRTSSGTYRCIAENNYSNGERGTDSQSMAVNVLCRYLAHNHINILCMCYRSLDTIFAIVLTELVCL